MMRTEARQKMRNHLRKTPSLEWQACACPPEVAAETTNARSSRIMEAILLVAPWIASGAWAAANARSSVPELHSHVAAQSERHRLVVEKLRLPCPRQMS